ncbi:uncharacterized protein N7458_009572 [Penicillium daleae]|uniref:Uncharacterized protein n=1 Tax=Penicillium daleae TaxID=63821 RepID=A0AAD6BX67_9EURO|nr:uncharacterized protein N7458_009572 [Penicillium daleae]KAJ5438574.1 hypothetical protein N7458_009572 [Penicillium daleae]
MQLGEIRVEGFLGGRYRGDNRESERTISCKAMGGYGASVKRYSLTTANPSRMQRNSACRIVEEMG